MSILKPKYVVAVFVLLNAIVAAAAWVSTRTWMDFFTTSGYFITLTGFLVAISELYRARTLAEQIREAQRQEARRQRGHHYRFCLERAKDSLADAQIHAELLQWSLARIRLNDLIVQLSHMNSISPAVDNIWTQFTDSARGWIVKFASGRNGRKMQYDRSEWHQFAFLILHHLDSELAPFQMSEVDDDTE